jgi:hypothetical protein
MLELPGTGWCAIVGHKRQEVCTGLPPRPVQLVEADYQDALKAVVPLPLHTTSLKPSSLKSIFSSLAGMTISDLPASIPPLAPDVTTLRNQILAQKGQDTDTIEEEREEEEEGKAEKEITKQELDKEMIYMGIVTSDSTVVYYKLTKGIKKPADIPDE